MPATSTTTKPKPIRAGDLCRIVVPEFVVRVGYPMTVSTEAAKLLESRGLELRETAIRLAGGYGSGKALEKVVGRMARDLAYLRCTGMGWGGRERTIHRLRLDCWKDNTFHVQGVRFVKTGTYVPGQSYRSFEGEYDYDPPCLADETTHRILATPFNDTIGDGWRMGLEIEAENCERIGV